MTDDERAIRNLVDTWMTATKAGDQQTVLSLMSDDVIFMTPGREPFGKAAFAAGSGSPQDTEFDGRADIKELQILGDWAYLRNYIDLTYGGRVHLMNTTAAIRCRSCASSRMADGR